jgi:hypothetical protein
VGIDITQNPAILLPMKTKTPTSTRILSRSHTFASDLRPLTIRSMEFHPVTPMKIQREPQNFTNDLGNYHKLRTLKGKNLHQLSAIIFAAKR